MQGRCQATRQDQDRLWPRTLSRPDIGARVFLRGLGAVYLIAFYSLARQIIGLVGEGGILPVKQLVAHLSTQTNLGFAAWPSIFWWDASDRSLVLVTYAGMAAAALVMLRLAQPLCLAICYLLYLSLVHAGQDFLAYQWDTLLLESGVLGLIIALSHSSYGGSVWSRRLARVAWAWALWRLMFAAGLVKLASGDPSWRDGTALNYHFETQPIPNPLAAFAHFLPPSLLLAATYATLFIELAAPWAVLLSGRWRLAGLIALLALMLLIALTGNYGFFNLLSALLCLVLLDDAVVHRLWPRRWSLPPVRDEIIKTPTHSLKACQHGLPVLRAAVTVLVACYLALAGLQGVSELIATAGYADTLPKAWHTARSKLAPWYLHNRYGLFAVMTKERREINFELSTDQKVWVPVRFRYKINAASDQPPWLGWHMPRLDWQMWFAALGRFEDSRWLTPFTLALLGHKSAVLALLEPASAKETVWRYARASSARYRFADDTQHELYWQISDNRPYLPIVGLAPLPNAAP